MPCTIDPTVTALRQRTQPVLIHVWVPPMMQLCLCQDQHSSKRHIIQYFVWYAPGDVYQLIEHGTSCRKTVVAVIIVVFTVSERTFCYHHAGCGHHGDCGHQIIHETACSTQWSKTGMLERKGGKLGATSAQAAPAARAENLYSKHCHSTC